MSIKSNLGELRELFYDGLLYIKTKIKGGTYADFYGQRMNRRIKKNPNWGLNLNKEFQLTYLKKHGLMPNHKFLDFGCGAIAAGRHFISYLDKGMYTGLDVSEAVLDEAKSRIKSEGLLDKEAQLVHIPAGDISLLPASHFDYLLAQSVFTHMPPDEISTLMSKIRNYMNESSTFFFTFVPPKDSKDKHKRNKLKDWQHSEEAMKTICNTNGFQFTIMDDWVHPDAPGVDRLGCAKITNSNSD